MCNSERWITGDIFQFVSSFFDVRCWISDSWIFLGLNQNEWAYFVSFLAKIQFIHSRSDAASFKPTNVFLSNLFYHNIKNKQQTNKKIKKYFVITSKAFASVNFFVDLKLMNHAEFCVSCDQIKKKQQQSPERLFTCKSMIFMFICLYIIWIFFWNLRFGLIHILIY